MIYILPFLIGFSIVFASIVNGQVAKRVGMIKGIQLNYLVGSVSALILTAITGIASNNSINFSSIPLIFMIGSFFGIGVLFFMNQIVSHISAFYIVLLPFVGQMLVSGGIDYFYLDILSKGKIIGAMLILIGILCNAILERTSPVH